MALPTYHDIAEQLGIPYCGGRQPSGFTCAYPGSHERGFIANGQVHWSNRMTTREGLKRFLMLGAQVNLRPVPEAPKWLVLWLKLNLVWGWADKIGVRFPGRPARLDVFAHERAQLKAMLVKVPADENSRAAAWAWASKR